MIKQVRRCKHLTRNRKEDKKSMKNMKYLRRARGISCKYTSHYHKRKTQHGNTKQFEVKTNRIKENRLNVQLVTKK